MVYCWNKNNSRKYFRILLKMHRKVVQILDSFNTYISVNIVYFLALPKR
jgi:hypothetical protein